MWLSDFAISRRAPSGSNRHDLSHRRGAADLPSAGHRRRQCRRRGARHRARGRRRRPVRLLPRDLSGTLAHAGDVRSDRGHGRGGGEAQDSRGVRDHRADRCGGRHGLQSHLHGLSLRPRAFRGAELIFMPAGKDKGKLWATWRTLIWARAIENLAIVVTTQNLFDHSERGLAMVASPEEILFESTIAGTTVVDVSLERVRYLRSTRDVVGSSELCAVKQGLLGSQWQRPELYETFYPRPRREAA